MRFQLANSQRIHILLLGYQLCRDRYNLWRVIPNQFEMRNDQSGKLSSDDDKPAQAPSPAVAYKLSKRSELVFFRRASG